MTEIPTEGTAPVETTEAVKTPAKRKREPTSTVGRGKAVTRTEELSATEWTDGQTSVFFGDSLDHYDRWETPGCIVSDGAYGVLGFEGDTSDHTGMPEWYV